MATKVLLALLAVTLAVAVNTQEVYRNRGTDSFDGRGTSSEAQEEVYGPNFLLNFLFNFQPGGVKPWWQGPNVCESETVEERNATTEGEDVMEVARHFSSSFQTCDESESAYKCTMSTQNQDGFREVVVIYECCPGYEREKGDHGCPRRLQLRDVMTLASDLGLSEFVGVVHASGLEQELRSREVTVFAPVNGGFGESPDMDMLGPEVVLQQDAPYTLVETDDITFTARERIQSSLLNHVISGSRRSSSFKDEQVVETGGSADTGVRINFFYTPPNKKMMTANCVPVVSRDNRARNGVIHTVEQFLPEVTYSLIDMVASRPDLSMLKTVLAAARYVPKLDADGQGTLLAPSDYAFGRMNQRLKQRLLAGDVKCLKKFLDSHILPHTICSAVVQGKARTPNALGNYLNISRTEDGKLFVHGAQIIQRDLMATNGVMHIIDKVIVPKEALDFVDVLEEEGFTELLSLIDQAGLTNRLATTGNLTIFAPTNTAIQNLPRSLRAQLTRDPELLRRVINFHVSPGVADKRHLHSDQMLTTLAHDTNIRVKAYYLHPFHRYGILTAQCAPLTGTRIDACNGKIRVLDEVMVPPRGTVVDVLARDKKFSMLVSLIKRAKLADALQEDGPFTVFAPNNKAFERLDQTTLEELSNDVDKLTDFLKRHVIKDHLCCAGMFRGHSWFGHSRVMTLSGDRVRISRDYTNTPKVERSRVLTCDLTATNGNVLEIESVLQGRGHSNHRRRWHWDHFSHWDRF